MADQAKRDIGEQSDHARLFEKGAEQDEQKDVGGRYIDRNAVNTFGAVGHVIDHLLEVVATMIQRRGQVLAEQAVGQKYAGDDRQGRPHQDPCCDEDQNQGDHTDDDVALQGIARP